MCECNQKIIACIDVIDANVRALIDAANLYIEMERSKRDQIFNEVLREMAKTHNLELDYDSCPDLPIPLVKRRFSKDEEYS